MGARPLWALTVTLVVHRLHRNMTMVCEGQFLTHGAPWEWLEWAIKDKNKKCQPRLWTACAGGRPLCVLSCLSLHFKGISTVVTHWCFTFYFAILDWWWSGYLYGCDWLWKKTTTILFVIRKKVLQLLPWLWFIFHICLLKHSSQPQPLALFCLFCNKSF